MDQKYTLLVNEVLHADIGRAGLRRIVLVLDAVGPRAYGGPALVKVWPLVIFKNYIMLQHTNVSDLFHNESTKQMVNLNKKHIVYAHVSVK